LPLGFISSALFGGGSKKVFVKDIVGVVFNIVFFGSLSKASFVFAVPLWRVQGHVSKCRAVIVVVFLVIFELFVLEMF